MKRLFIPFILFICCALFSEKPELKLNFLVDEDYLIEHTLKRGLFEAYSYPKLYHDEIEAFQDAACMGKNPKELLRLAMQGSKHPNYQKFVLDMKNKLEYQVILQQTHAYAELCEKRWEETKSLTIPFMEELTGISFDRTFEVYISHPGLCNGTSEKPSKIFWGNSERWPHYTVVYLWHELLHDYFDYTHIDHAIIQFLADNQLRKHLSGGDCISFVGHDHLTPFMEAMQEDWNALFGIGSKRHLYFF